MSSFLSKADIKANTAKVCFVPIVAVGQLLVTTLFELLRLESSRWPFTLGRGRLPVDYQAIAFSSALLASGPLESRVAPI
jgi:hypothetical protein